METAVVGSLQGTEAGSLLVAGVPTEGSETASVVFPYDGSEIGRVWLAGEELLARALAAAAAAEAEIAAIPSFRRAEILARAAELMRGREDELARQTTLETGNPLDPETVVGGLIDEAAAEKAIDLVEEARRAGAEVLCGTREGTVGRADAPPRGGRAPARVRGGGLRADHRARPLLGRRRGARGGERLALRPSGRPLSTNDIRIIQRAFERLEVGALIVNNVNTFRSTRCPTAASGSRASAATGSGTRSAR